jgi:polyamine oxidase
MAKDSSMTQKQPHKKVLILGAGLSGIVAGKTLLDNGIDDFLILEGQDYIGGRIKQVRFVVCSHVSLWLP